MDEELSDKEVVLANQRFSPLKVEFESGNPTLLKEVAEKEVPLNSVKATGELFLPEGDPVGRPAVLLAHGLAGQMPVRELTYGAKLAKAGYVALALDSFRARGLDWVPDDLKAVGVTTWALLADIFAGLRFLAAHPAVDPKAISIMGFSWGGMTTVLSSYEQIRRAFLEEEDLRFAGHVSYYGCSIPRMEDPKTTGAPVLMLVAEHDRNVSVERSRQICDDLRAGGSESDLRVLDAYHQWDGQDFKKRHVLGSLGDLRFLINRNNQVLDETDQTEMKGAVSSALLILRGVDWRGYDILRDEEVHRQTDELLFDFLGRVAAREGLPPPDADNVPLGEIGEPAEKRSGG